jgi:hypothetical protein
MTRGFVFPLLDAIENERHKIFKQSHRIFLAVWGIPNYPSAWSLAHNIGNVSA